MSRDFFEVIVYSFKVSQIIYKITVFVVTNELMLRLEMYVFFYIGFIKPCLYEVIKIIKFRELIFGP